VTATAPAAFTRPRTFADAEATLARSLPGYTPRPYQQRLAAAIESGIAREVILIAEAGTGTGKSLAALIPAILAGKRVIVATATKALQDQYKNKDLPFLAEHLGVPFTWAVLKGRSNYPCASKIADLTRDRSVSRRQLPIIEIVQGMEKTGGFADRDSLPTVMDAEWQQLSMSSNECPGRGDCPFGETACHSYRAKDAADSAQVVVTNLAYLAVDFKLRKETGGAVSLLGQFDVLIVDEAHNLDSAITSALSDTIAHGTFQKLTGNAAAWLRSQDLDEEEAMAVGHEAHQLWDTLNVTYVKWQERQRRERKDASDMPIYEKTRLFVLGERLQAMARALQALWKVLRDTEADSDAAWRMQQRLVRRVASLTSRMQAFATDEDTVTVRWIESERDQLLLRSVPVSPAPFLNEMFWGQIPSIVLMSATLAAGRTRTGDADFGYTIKSLGLAEHQPVTFESGTPFNYPEQALLFVPDKDQPVPSGASKGAWQMFAQQATEYLVRQAGGGALLLFTSRSAMNEAYLRLAPGFEEDGLEVLKQGDEPTPVLIRKFKEDGNAVLFALRTFFEGVDIPGDALRLVVLDKLPFPVPTDLQFKARCDAANTRAGRDVSFREISMPVMTLPLVQAAGRLLRTATDRGVIAILDPRLMSKGYGAQILQALPPARRTTDPREAARFLQAMQS
jgi:ATP-dependent DNA helicase DinG